MTDPSTLFTMNAVPYLFMAQATGLTNNTGIMQTFHLATPDGKIKISMDPELFARAKFPVAIDDGVLVSLTLIKGTAVDVPDVGGLVMPDKRIVRPS